jgi:hypothetical protein
MKKLILFFLLGFVISSACVFADITKVNMPNGRVFFESDSTAKACGTSDGGEVVIEKYWDSNGNQTFYYYKYDSDYNIVTNKKLVKTFPKTKNPYNYDVACDSNNAYIVAEIASGSNYGTSNITGHTFTNASGYCSLQYIFLDSSGDVDYSSETSQKTYTILDVDVVVDTYVQILFSTGDYTYQEQMDSTTSYSESDFDIRYIRLDKSSGSEQVNTVVWSNFASKLSASRDGSDNVYVLYSKSTGLPSNIYTDILFAKINETGGIVVGPVKLNTNDALGGITSSNNGLAEDSSGNLHAIWAEGQDSQLSDDDTLQIKYAKLNSTGGVLATNTLTSHPSYTDKLEFINMQVEFGNPNLDVYYSHMKIGSVTGIPNDAIADDDLYWLNVTTGGSVVDTVKQLENKWINDLGQATGSEGGQCQPCGEPPGTPEFHSGTLIFSIIILVAVALIAIIILGKKK